MNVVETTLALCVEDGPSQVTPNPPRKNDRIGWRELLLLAVLTAAALLVHGYHGGVEDAEIYQPGVLQHLNPALFPRNAQFFSSHAGMTMFPSLMANSILLLHLTPEWTTMLWHIATIFGLLLGCFRIARLCFPERHTVWCGVGLVASLLTMPVAGTALYIMDQYVTSRSFSTAASMLALAALLERRYVAGVLWALFTVAVHPLMGLFLVVLLGMVLVFKSQRNWEPVLFVVFPFTMFPPVSKVYEEVLREHPYFLITNWAWYEWLGIFGPLVILIGMAVAFRRAGFGPMVYLAKALAAFEVLFLIAAAFISVPGPLERFAELQPMRCLLPVYIVMLLFGGCLLGKWVLRRRTWRWALLFAPLCAGMALAQVDLFPDTGHLEWPWEQSRNSWVRGFAWIRTHTPPDAYFALDPDYERLPGEDVHGFRVLAQRSMLADNGKDSGAVSMFPSLAGAWSEQVDARRGWKQFGRADFLRLKAQYGVDWVVLQQPGTSGLKCPYQNERILVCRVN